MVKSKFTQAWSLIIAVLVVMMTALAPVQSAYADTETKELVIDDTSYGFIGYVEGAPDATIIKISTNGLGISGNSKQEFTLPERITMIQGWQKKTFFDEEKVMQRSLGNPNYPQEKLTIPSGSDLTVNNIDFTFSEDSALIIEEGATVKFNNCTFTTAPLNNGTATFTNCTFKSGRINNNGTAEYIGTEEPENIGSASENPSSTPLSLSVDTREASGVVGRAFSLTRSTIRGGSNKDTADWSAEITPADSGLTASWKNDQLVISGTPSAAGSYKVTLKGTDGSDTITRSIPITIDEKLQVRLAGSFADVAIGQGADSVDATSGASINTSSGSSYPKIEVKVGDGDWISYSDFREDHSSAEVSARVEGEGEHSFKADVLYDSIALSGSSDTPGVYSVIATLTYGEQSVESKPLKFNVFDLNVSFADRLKAVSEDVEHWMMAPWKMSNTIGGATVPTHFKTIAGSNESGLYGEIGTNERTAADDIIIPAGADVRFRNMKFLSSTRIIVEKGAKFTLDDSVTYGPVIVNGGTFSSRNSSAAVGGITLNDGSTLEDADIKGSYYLTDGNPDLTYPDTLVTVNGNVTVKGSNKLTGSVGGGPSLPGETALTVNGTLTLEDGSTLEAAGGGDKTTFYSPYGGDGIRLNNGRIIGKGKVTAVGGSATNGINKDTTKKLGGDGISGNGIVDVDELTAIGGDSGEEGSVFGKGVGGNATAEGVKVHASKLVTKGGYGTTTGSSEPTPYDPASDSTSVPDTPTEPTVPADPSDPGKTTTDTTATVRSFFHMKAVSSRNITRLSWSKVKGADGYDIYIFKNGKRLRKYTSARSTSMKVKKLKAGRAYKFRVRAYKLKNGRKTIIAKTPLCISIARKGFNKRYTDARALTVTPKVINLKVGETVKLKAKVNKVKKGRKLVSYASAPSLRYFSSNKGVSTASSDGRLKAVSAGSCRIYVYAANGVKKTVTVNVSK